MYSHCGAISNFPTVRRIKKYLIFNLQLSIQCPQFHHLQLGGYVLHYFIQLLGEKDDRNKFTNRLCEILRIHK